MSNFATPGDAGTDPWSLDHGSVLSAYRVAMQTGSDADVIRVLRIMCKAVGCIFFALAFTAIALLAFADVAHAEHNDSQYLKDRTARYVERINPPNRGQAWRRRTHSVPTGRSPGQTGAGVPTCRVTQTSRAQYVNGQWTVFYTGPVRECFVKGLIVETRLNLTGKGRFAVRPVYEDDPWWDCRTMGNRQCGPNR